MKVRVALVVVSGFAAAACNDGSLVNIPLSNNGPVAVISGGQSQYQPLDIAMLDALQSHDEDGTIVDFDWEVTQRPLGSNSLIEELDGGRYAEFFVDLAGDYTVRLVVTDDGGSSDMATFSFSAVPYEAVHVQLTWNINYADVDLHLVNETQWLAEPGNGPSSHPGFYTEPWDCFFANPEPDWGDTSAPSDPRLDIDDTEGFGPENINLDGPENGTRYRVYVHYYSDDGEGSTTARIRIYLSGELKWEGTKALSGTGRVWNVASIDWPSGAIQPNGQIFDHSYTGFAPQKPSF